jgi:hypothetical protein
MVLSVVPGHAVEVIPVEMLPNQGYELRVGYLGSHPVDMRLAWAVTPSPTGRTLLDAEKLVFWTDPRGRPVGQSGDTPAVVMISTVYNGVSAEVSARQQPIQFALGMGL